MDNNRISIAAIGEVTYPQPMYLQIGDATIEITPRISYEELLTTMQWVIDMVVGEKPFMSAPLTRIVKDFAILNAYTNLDLGVNHAYDNMSQIYAEYDLIHSFGVMEDILPKLDKKQITFFEKTIDETMKSIVDYRNSAKGIVDALAASAESDSNALNKALEFMGDPEQQSQIATILKAAEAVQGG